MTRKLPTLASLLLGAASAPAMVRALHPSPNNSRCFCRPRASQEQHRRLRAAETRLNPGVGPHFM
jgi:hypothetical protein